MHFFNQKSLGSYFCHKNLLSSGLALQFFSKLFYFIFFFIFLSNHDETRLSELIPGILLKNQVMSEISPIILQKLTSFNLAAPIYSEILETQNWCWNVVHISQTTGRILFKMTPLESTRRVLYSGSISTKIRPVVWEIWPFEHHTTSFDFCKVELIIFSFPLLISLFEVSYVGVTMFGL